MWADTDSNVDYLNYSEVAEMIAEMIGNPSLLPLSLGIFGTWGTGKSSILNLARAELLREPDRYLIIEFDAWLYQDFDDAKAALMAVIAKALIDASPETGKEKAKSFLKRVNKLKALGLLAEAGAALHGLPTFGMLGRALESFGNEIASDEDVGEKIEKTLETAEKKTEGLIKKKEKRSPPEEITAFRHEFKDILHGLKRTLVVFIDNLDRCSPPNTIHTLEAIRLFLFMPSTAFVIAADEDMIRHAVSQHFNRPSERHVADYLDKLIQVPVRVPRIGVQEVRAYLFSLFAANADLGEEKAAKLNKLQMFILEQLRNSWKRDSNFAVAQVVELLDAKKNDHLRSSLDLADRIAPLLTYSANVKGNPRIIKRMLNVIHMRSSVARRRGIPLDEAMIAKLAIFERCTDVTSIEALHNAINAVENGSPSFLASLEMEADRSREADVDIPEKLKTHMAFLRDWAALEPKLAGIDLKPAIYLARETVPLRNAASNSSAEFIKALAALLETATVSSPAARKAIASVDPSDHVKLMDSIVREMRRDTDWSKSRSDFRGALVLAEVSAETGEHLMRFIRSLEMAKLPGWMATLTRDKPWFER
jgi:predicted KAP-like P-loop ATPase